MCVCASVCNGLTTFGIAKFAIVFRIVGFQTPEKENAANVEQVLHNLRDRQSVLYHLTITLTGS